MRVCTKALISRVCGYHLVEPDSSLKLIIIAGDAFWSQLGIKGIRGNEWMVSIIQSSTRYKTNLLLKP
jgi:hypothetical protein